MHQRIKSPTPSQTATHVRLVDSPSPTQAKLSVAFAPRQLASVIKKKEPLSVIAMVYILGRRIHSQMRRLTFKQAC